MAQALRAGAVGDGVGRAGGTGGARGRPAHFAPVGGRQVLACGNGGSAADAQHFVAELVGRMSRDRRALPALSLASDPSNLTALSNDYGFERVFARQVEALGAPGDVLLAITTSGRSRNVLAALETARQAGLPTILLTGADPSQPAADIVIAVPSRHTQRVQEVHMAILHSLCERIEAHFVCEAQNRTTE
ncbi:SIS domain-containing protein [bacterium]|nr:SIS domain-containing protein [bacterium]